MKPWELEIRDGSYKAAKGKAVKIVVKVAFYPEAIIRILTTYEGYNFVLVYELDAKTCNYYRIRSWWSGDILFGRINSALIPLKKIANEMMDEHIDKDRKTKPYLEWKWLQKLRT